MGSNLAAVKVHKTGRPRQLTLNFVNTFKFIMCLGILCIVLLFIRLQKAARPDPTAISSKSVQPSRKITNSHGTSISLFLRMSGDRHDHKERLYCNILKTVALFWPSWLGTMVIVFDEGVKDRRFASKLLNQTKHYLPHHKVAVRYEPLPQDATVLNFPGQLKPPGYNRQLWSSFFIDLYSNDDVIAWMDSDSPLLLPVTMATVMPRGKVRILGTDCTMSINWVRSWSQSTKRAIGFPQIADFMTYFPVYLYRETFRRCREYILKRFNTDDFEEAFKKFHHTGTGYISPVSVVISYAWLFERDSYDWKIEMCGDLEKYNEHLPEGHKIRPEDVVNKSVLLSQPQTAFHGPLNDKDIFPRIIPISYCLSISASGRHEHICRKHPRSHIKYLFDLFKSDTHTLREQLPHPCIGDNVQYCLRILRNHFRKVAVEIKTKKRRMKWKDFAVKANALASEVGVTCPAHPV